MVFFLFFPSGGEDRRDFRAGQKEDYLLLACVLVSAR